METNSLYVSQKKEEEGVFFITSSLEHGNILLW